MSHGRRAALAMGCRSLGGPRSNKALVAASAASPLPALGPGVGRSRVRTAAPTCRRIQTASPKRCNARVWRHRHGLCFNFRSKASSPTYWRRIAESRRCGSRTVAASDGTRSATLTRRWWRTNLLPTAGTGVEGARAVGTDIPRRHGVCRATIVYGTAASCLSHASPSSPCGRRIACKLFLFFSALLLAQARSSVCSKSNGPGLLIALFLFLSAASGGVLRQSLKYGAGHATPCCRSKHQRTQWV